MILFDSQYITKLEYAIKEMIKQGKAVDCLIEIIQNLKARYPNPKTRLDLHQIFLEESEKPIFPLYCTLAEIYMIQNYGRVPTYKSKKWNQLMEEYNGS